MNIILKFTAIVTLIMAVQFVYVQSSFGLNNYPNSLEVAAFEPPDEGGPETSQGAGTR